MTPRDTLPPFRPGLYLTRDGTLATVEYLDERGRARGFAPGYLRTWWHPDGRHNLTSSDDLQAWIATPGFSDELPPTDQP